MDTRIINTLYGREAMEMFVAIAQLCLEVPPEDGPPGIPQLVPHSGSRVIYQTWGEEPFTSGVGVYYRLADDGKTVQFWDCEQAGYDFTEVGLPTFTFPLSDLKEMVMKWAQGEL